MRSLPLSVWKPWLYSRQILTLSSEPSSQSGSPSQCHRFGTHWLFSHTKSEAEQVFFTAGRPKEKQKTWSSAKVKDQVVVFSFIDIKTTHLWRERRNVRRVSIVTSRKSQWALLSHCLLLEMYLCVLVARRVTALWYPGDSNKRNKSVTQRAREKVTKWN